MYITNSGKGDNIMRKNIFDYDSGEFAQTISDNMAMDMDGNLLMRMGDNMVMEMDSGDLHITTSWPDEYD